MCCCGRSESCYCVITQACLLLPLRQLAAALEVHAEGRHEGVHHQQLRQPRGGGEGAKNECGRTRDACVGVSSSSVAHGTRATPRARVARNARARLEGLLRELRRHLRAARGARIAAISRQCAVVGARSHPCACFPTRRACTSESMSASDVYTRAQMICARARGRREGPTHARESARSNKSLDARAMAMDDGRHGGARTLLSTASGSRQKRSATTGGARRSQHKDTRRLRVTKSFDAAEGAGAAPMALMRSGRNVPSAAMRSGGREGGA
jgi:hypothetical protein